LGKKITAGKQVDFSSGNHPKNDLIMGSWMNPFASVLDLYLDELDHPDIWNHLADGRNSTNIMLPYAHHVKRTCTSPSETK
jgi:hypothetical protein